MSQMTEAYLAAMKLSYANQEGGITIPSSELNKFVTIPLGFQPLGITSHSNGEGGDIISLAAYFEPAICQAEVTRDSKGLHFTVSWIRGVKHGIQSVRLFPDISQPSGANRAQTVNFHQGRLWVTRNSERDFYLLKPPEKPLDRWELIDMVSLPVGQEGYQMVHSALWAEDNVLLTIETGNLENWYTKRYGLSQDELVSMDEIAPWRYGIGKDASGYFYTLTDFRSSEPHGIYEGNRLVVPGIDGNGICFLSDGSALVSRYGQSHPEAFNGVPGALIYVPADHFK